MPVHCGPYLLPDVNPSSYFSCPHLFYWAACHSYPMVHLSTTCLTLPRSQSKPWPLWVSQAEMLHPSFTGYQVERWGRPSPGSSCFFQATLYPLGFGDPHEVTLPSLNLISVSFQLAGHSPSVSDSLLFLLHPRPAVIP